MVEDRYNLKSTRAFTSLLQRNKLRPYARLKKLHQSLQRCVLCRSPVKPLLLVEPLIPEAPVVACPPTLDHTTLSMSEDVRSFPMSCHYFSKFQTLLCGMRGDCCAGKVLWLLCSILLLQLISFKQTDEGKECYVIILICR